MSIQQEIKRLEQRLIFVSNIETYTVDKAIQKAVLLIEIARIIYGFEMMKGNQGLKINWFGYNMAVPDSKNPFEEGKKIALMGKQLSKLNQE